MSRLSAHNLPKNTQLPSYDRAAVSTGIVHFGTGNFHRAHQAVYVDDLLSQGALEWGITGVSLRSSSMKDALAPQNFLYTLAVLGETTSYRVVGAIQNILVAPENPQAVVDIIAAQTIQLVSATITEKGYYLASGKIDFSHPDLQSETLSLRSPKTIYGFLAKSIIQRAKQSHGDAALTVMCCDNISGGGAHLRVGVETLLNSHDSAALQWCRNNVGFVSSMVDRVTPATQAQLRAAVPRGTGKDDAWPVSAEPFSQWIIEEHFKGKRPDFDSVGAVFVDDIAPYENMKLRYLNAAHTIVSTLGYLSGDKYVHEALERPEVFQFMQQALTDNILPVAQVPQGYDGASYIQDVITRFQNRSLPYANLQVGTDSSHKIQQRWFPTIDLALAQCADTSYFEFSLGAWVNFVKDAVQKGVLNDPKVAAFEAVLAKDIDNEIIPFLDIANAEKFDLYSHSNFVKSIKIYADEISNKGIRAALRRFLDH